ARKYGSNCRSRCRVLAAWSPYRTNATPFTRLAASVRKRLSSISGRLPHRREIVVDRLVPRDPVVAREEPPGGRDATFGQAGLGEERQQAIRRVLHVGFGEVGERHPDPVLLQHLLHVPDAAVPDAGDPAAEV